MKSAAPEDSPKTPAGPAIRVVIADDARSARESLVLLLHTYPGLEVVGVAENGLEAILQVEALRPDLVILDLDMPVQGGLSAAREIRSRHRAIRILMISIHESLVWEEASRLAGADEFLSKPALPLRLGAAIERHFGNPVE